jgi:hypothetical protein
MLSSLFFSLFKLNSSHFYSQGRTLDGGGCV